MEEKPTVVMPAKPETTGRGSCGGTSPLPEGKTWLPHVGNRQRLRELKRSYKRFEKLLQKNEKAGIATLHASRDRLLDAITEVTEQSAEEITVYFAIHAALIKSQETGKPVEEFLDRAADELLATPRVSKAWNVAA